jgi:hypothetical protein
MVLSVVREQPPVIAGTLVGLQDSRASAILNAPKDQGDKMPPAKPVVGAILRFVQVGNRAHWPRRAGVGRRGMPKSVATIFGLALVASSIGFNTWRYPAVLRMVGSTPVASEESSQALASKSAEESATPASAEPESATPSPVLATKTEAMAEPAGKPVPVATPSPEAKPPIAVVPAATESAATQPNNSEKPLVPVPKVTIPEKARAVDNVVVRRLPPVDPGVLPPDGNTPASNGAIRIYPSTGLQ